MGAYYQSLQIKTPSRETVIAMADALVQKNKEAKLFIGPEIKGWIAVYLDDPGLAKTFAQEVGRDLDCVVLNLAVYDSDIFAYSFYEKGQLADEYSSRPDQFGEVSTDEHERLKGKPDLFRNLLARGKNVNEIESILSSKDDEKYRHEEDRMEEFAKLLGIENTFARYEYLIGGEWEGIKGRREFVHFPDQTAKKTAARAAAASVRAAFTRLKKQGLLCFESQPVKKYGSPPGEAFFDPLNGGILFSLKGFREGVVLTATPPWVAEPERLKTPLSPEGPHHLTFSKDGKWLAYFDGRLRLWDWPKRRIVEGIDIRSTPLQFSPDGTLLVCQNARRFEIFSTETMKIVESVDGGTDSPGFRAWHPAHRFLLTGHTRPGDVQLGLISLEAGKLVKTLCIGTFNDLLKLAGQFGKTPAGLSEEQFAPIWPGGGLACSNKIEFSLDGRLLFCATSIGLLVLEWDKVLAAKKSTPPALFVASALPPEPWMQQQQQQPPENFLKNMVYDLAFDEKANRVLFAGYEGTIRFLSLNDGSAGILLKPPGHEYISSLQMSRDREFIYCYCSTFRFDEAERDKPDCMRIWNYRLLRSAAGLD